MKTPLQKRHIVYVLLFVLLFCSRLSLAYSSRTRLSTLNKIVSAPPASLFRINTGGGNTATSTGSFSADQFYSLPSYAKSVNAAIAATTDDALYQTERWGSKNLNYNIPVANGKYKIVLHFAEIYFTNSGQRVFDINVEGVTRRDNFDIVAKVGPLTATTETINTVVVDGVLQINFNSEAINGGVNNPTISAIEVFELRPPVLAMPIADISAEIGVPFSYTIPSGTFVDPDDDILSISATLLNNLPLPSWLSFNVNTQTFTGTPPVGSPATIVIMVTASDGNGGSVSDAFILNLSGPYVPLSRINAGGANISTSGGNFSSDQFYSSPSYAKNVNAAIAGTNDDALYRSERWGQKSLNYNFPLNNGQYKVILHFAEIVFSTSGKRVFDVNLESNNVLNNYDIVAKVGAFTATTESFFVNVTDGALNINFNSSAAVGGVDNPKVSAIEILGTSTSNPPVVAIPLTDQNVVEGTSFTFTIPAGTFLDADNDFLTYSATLSDGSSLPQWLSFNATTSAFSGTPTPDSPKTLVIKLTASDGSISVSDDFVININHLPVLVIDAFGIDEGVPFSFKPIIDPDGDTLTITYALDPGRQAGWGTWDIKGHLDWLQYNPSTQSFYGTLPSDFPSHDDYFIDVIMTANDGKGGIIETSTYVPLTTINDVPKLKKPFPDITAIRGQYNTTTYDINEYSDDDDAISSQYNLGASYKMADGSPLPSWVFYDTHFFNEFIFEVNPPAGSPDSLLLQLVVTDTWGASITSDFVVYISNPAPVNHPPVVTTDAILIQEGTPFTLTPFEDPDGDSLTITYAIYPHEEGGYFDMPRYLDWFKYNPATNSFFGAIPANFPYGDNYYFDVVATADDGKGGITYSSIFINCELTNAPLILTKPFPNVNAVRGEYGGVIFDVNEYAQDPDAGFWRYNLGASFKMADGSAIPSWVRAEGYWQDEFIFEVNPPADSPDSLLFQITISDNWGDRVTSNFVLYISDAESITSNARIAAEEKSGNDKTIATASPNPFTNIVNVKVEGRGEQEYLVKVNNIMGKEFYTGILPANEDLIAIDFSKIPNLPQSNLFLITVEDKSKTFRKILRVIKN